VIWESQGNALLTASLVRPFGLAAAGWLTLRVLRVRHPASQHAVWTAVLIGMMMLPVVSLFAPHWNVPLLSRKHDSALSCLRLRRSGGRLETCRGENGNRSETGREACLTSISRDWSLWWLIVWRAGCCCGV
jgi:MFS family permease